MDGFRFNIMQLKYKRIKLIANASLLTKTYSDFLYGSYLLNSTLQYILIKKSIR